MNFYTEGYFQLEADAAWAVDVCSRKLKLPNKLNFRNERSFAIEREQEEKVKGKAPNRNVIEERIHSRIDHILNTIRQRQVQL